MSDIRNKRLLKLAKVLEILNISKPTFYRLVESDELKAYKIGKEWRIDSDDLDAFLMKKKETFQIHLST